jgi:hypothetical protein
MDQHQRWYGCLQNRGRIGHASFVVATLLIVMPALSAQAVVNFRTHCPTCDDPGGRYSQIAPMLALPMWLGHQQLRSAASHSQLLNESRTVVSVIDHAYEKEQLLAKGGDKVRLSSPPVFAENRRGPAMEVAQVITPPGKGGCTFNCAGTQRRGKSKQSNLPVAS